MMNILHMLFPSESIAFSILAIALTGAVGLFIGNIKIFKINIGIAGVLFAGIVFSYLGLNANEKILEFIREFGLILFVYAVGTQVGPGFFSSFKKDGIKLNMMAISVVLGTIAVMLAVHKAFNIPITMAIGMYCGAVTNTPSLAAAQQSILNTSHLNSVNDISVGYALAYPGAIVAIILSMVMLRLMFKKESEQDMENALAVPASAKIETVNIEVENKNLNGIMIKDIPAIDELNVVISRISREGNISLAHEDDKIFVKDVILVVGLKENLDKFIKIIGSASKQDLAASASKIIHSRAIVSKKNVIGKTILESGLLSHNVIATRVSRADVEFIIPENYRLQFGDNIVLVGDENDIKKAASLLGDSPKDLNHPQLIPVFIGIIVGVIIGSIPFNIPGFSQPLKLGLAGGPLIAAIFFSYIQNIGTVSWYMPPAGNLMLREIGIILFLASVGLKSGDSFFQSLLMGQGLKIAALAFTISFFPVFLCALFLKFKYKTNYLSLSGAMAGSMTDPPALAFANSLSASNLSSMSYASVYPLVMFLRIISAQILVLFFLG